MSHTYVTLEVSGPAYDEIARKLRDADYHHVFDTTRELVGGRLEVREVVDMHGIALVREVAR